MGIDVVPYIYISCIPTRATPGRPYMDYLFIYIMPYIHTSCLPIRATRGRPYKVADDFVGACLSSPAAIPEMYILVLWLLFLFSISIYSVYQHGPDRPAPTIVFIHPPNKKPAGFSDWLFFYFPTSWQRVLIKSSTLMGADTLWLPALNWL